MHEPKKSRLGWLVLVGVYWALQALYLLSPIDLLPDVVPVVGFADDLIGVIAGLLVTLFGVYKAFEDRLALPRNDERVLETTAEPVPTGFTGYVPRRDHADYEPLTPDELKAL